MRVRLKIKVTQNQIGRGEQNNPRYCPIANSINDTPGPGGETIHDALVTKARCVFYIGERRVECKTPVRAKRFIGRFDDRFDSVQPTNFILEIDDL